MSVTVVLASTEVAPGKPIKIAITIDNARSTPLVLESQYCGAPALFTAIARIPIDPAGRTWDGLASAYKTFALDQAEQQEEIGPTSIGAVATPCSDGGGWVATVPARGSTTTSLTWRAELVAGVPALPNEAVLYTVSVGYDPTCSPPPGMICGTVGSRGGCVFCWGWTFQHLTLAGTFRIAGPAPTVVTAGQAIDALLGDRRFVAWLAKEPKSTWSISNVTLENQGPAQGIVPAGANWRVDLFREKGVPRNWAIGFVDPRTGRLRNLTFCNSPCWR